MNPPRQASIWTVANVLKWKIYEDGIVVYVPATSETHILSLALAPVFQHSSILIEQAGRPHAITQAGRIDRDAPVLLAADTGATLARMKILVAKN